MWNVLSMQYKNPPPQTKVVEYQQTPSFYQEFRSHNFIPSLDKASRLQFLIRFSDVCQVSEN